MINDDEWYTPEQAGPLLGLTYTGVRSAIRDGNLVARKVGKRLNLVRGAELRRYRERQQTDPKSRGWVTRRAMAHLDVAAIMPEPPPEAPPLEAPRRSASDATQSDSIRKPLKLAYEPIKIGTIEPLKLGVHKPLKLSGYKAVRFDDKAESGPRQKRRRPKGKRNALTVNQASFALDLEPEAVRRLIKHGKLPGRKMQGIYWIDRAAVYAYRAAITAETTTNE